MLGNDTGNRKCLEEALKILNNTECEEDCLLKKCIIYLMFIRQEIDENFYMELLDLSLRSLHVVKEVPKPLLLIFYLTVGSKQLDSGKLKSSMRYLQQTLDIELDVSSRPIRIFLETFCLVLH